MSAARWRESASLIILAKDIKSLHKNTDYKTLLFKRHENVSFMPESFVFPGGVREAADESPDWMHYFKNFGIRDEDLNALTRSKVLRPPIFSAHTENCLQKDISLRITAIRETFEEVGILFARDRNSVEYIARRNFGCFYENFDRVYWQRMVHKDATQFLTLCRELDIVPDLWNLHEWSDWLTPASFKKRFETVFYLVTTDKIPNVIAEKHEVASYDWKTPNNFLRCSQRKELNLPPPQFYELSRLLNFEKLQQLQKFAYYRARNGTSLMLPVWCSCTDGAVGLLPGDDMYPADPNASNEVIDTRKSMSELRATTKKLHRSEYSQQGGVVLHLNFLLPDGHLNPVVLHTHEKL